MDYTSIKSLCPPAAFFLVISLMTIIILAFYKQLTGINVYCIAREECNLPSTTSMYIIKVFFVLFWTWILNSICQYGTTTIAWFLVLIPYLLFVITIVFYYLGGLAATSTALQNILRK